MQSHQLKIASLPKTEHVPKGKFSLTFRHAYNVQTIVQQTGTRSHLCPKVKNFEPLGTDP